MFDPSQYQLIDFGSDSRGFGEKLEQIGGYLIARPSPAAEGAKRQQPATWKDCHAHFETRKSDKESWQFSSADICEKMAGSWSIENNSVSLKIKPTPFGHIGLFAEQQTNWDWIFSKVSSCNRPVKVLNLFAYTGGSTLAAAAAGAEVTHIDSSKSVVNWARENAKLSQLAESPIRWIVEDCLLFVEREVKRGNQYDAIILDPPSFGHGPKGEHWKIERDLIRLLRNCKKLLSESPLFMLLTCHSQGYGPAELQATFCDAVFGSCSTQVTSMPLSLTTQDGRKLNAGNVVRWPR